MVTESWCQRLPGAQAWGQGNFSEGHSFPCPHSCVRIGSFAIASTESCLQNYWPTGAQKTPADMGRDAVFLLMKDGTDWAGALEIADGRFDFGPPRMPLPPRGRGFGREVGPAPIAACPPAPWPKLGTNEFGTERLPMDRLARCRLRDFAPGPRPASCANRRGGGPSFCATPPIASPRTKLMISWEPRPSSSWANPKIPELSLQWRKSG